MLINRRRLKVEWGHCDPANIVFYPQYLIWFDGCTQALLERLGRPMVELFREQGVVGAPLVDVQARFIIPSGCGDELEALSGVSEWGRSSFTVRHRFLKGGALAVEGFEKRVWAAPHPDQPGRIKATPIPDAIRAVLSTADA